jgi:hypothetical protein
VTRWRLTADELASILGRQKTVDRVVRRGKRLSTGKDAEEAFAAEMDPKAGKPTLQYDNIHAVDTTGCAIPQAAGVYPGPRICPWCKRELP